MPTEDCCLHLRSVYLDTGQALLTEAVQPQRCSQVAVAGQAPAPYDVVSSPADTALVSVHANLVWQSLEDVFHMASYVHAVHSEVGCVALLVACSLRDLWTPQLTIASPSPPLSPR